MVINKKGDILNATEDIICHQCNTKGTFDGGLAYQIKQVYPQCEKQVIDWLSYKEYFKGDYYLYVNKQDNKMIANCFTQNEDYTTNYEELRKCFTKLKNNCIDMKQTICCPYKYGCGIASGNWNIVLRILEDIFTDYDISIYELEKEV